MWSTSGPLELLVIPPTKDSNIIVSFEVPNVDFIIIFSLTPPLTASTDLEQELRKRGVKRILLGGILTNVCVMATAVQACDRLFRVCLVEEACGAFKRSWHEKAVSLLNEPQISGGHADGAVGLYFAEVATLADAQKALAVLQVGLRFGFCVLLEVLIFSKLIRAVNHQKNQ